ncbi:MAG TPA: 50S ribosomal protein L13 [Spirochaetota bacterium]|nr:50S ribosomal protein L13 [Spirochaetota bacterium]HOM38006.1 50S ribosomal protein L13 [Spirochaetota bacterium]HPQ48810.1 50S ribosomal protein L13 [Spirochaetota bacterium]
MKTYMKKKEDVKFKWYIIDAKDKVLGRLATKIVEILKGKNSPDYTPHIESGNGVIVINAKEVKVTGNKIKDKIYYWHSGHPGGIKSISFGEAINKNYEMPITRAVKGMLAKNRMRDHLLTRLRIFPGPEHNMEAQKPEKIEI